MSLDAALRRIARLEQQLDLHGTAVSDPCPRCEGTGWVERNVELAIMRDVAARLGEPVPSDDPGTTGCVLCKGRCAVTPDKATEYTTQNNLTTEALIWKLTAIVERHAAWNRLADSNPVVAGLLPRGPAGGVDRTSRHPDSPPPADDA